MELVAKVSAACIISALLALTIKKNSPETALLLGLAAAVTVLAAAAKAAGEISGFAVTLEEHTGLSPAVTAPLFKTVGIAIVTKLASDFARDSGQGALASSVELAGVTAAIYTALPLMRAMLSMIEGLI